MNRRKKIFINASTVLISGGYYLTLQIIQEFIRSEAFEMVIACPSRKKYQSCETDYSRLIIIPRWQLYRVFRLILDIVLLPGMIRRASPDLVFSLTNIPARTRYAQVFLHDNPYFGEHNLGQFNLACTKVLLHNLRSFVIRSRLSFVDLVLVQSEYQEEIFKNAYRKSLQIQILPPAITKTNRNGKTVKDRREPTDIKKILCLARYYEHKNLEVLIKVGKLIKEYQLPYILFLTIEKGQHRNVGKLLKKIKEIGLDDVIINLGKIKHIHLPEKLISYDAIILPSLLESFSLVFIEAWMHRKPLFVSDLPSIRSTCLEAAFYFNPRSEQSILSTIKDALDNPSKIEEMIEKGDTRLNRLPSWGEYSKVILQQK